MQELSLNVLDIAENSLAAGAKNVGITLEIDTAYRVITLRIIDDGKGMSDETAKRAVDPFYTTRTTRSVGFGLPFLKQLTQQTNGRFELKTKLGEGTTVLAQFELGHFDLPPLGDMPATIVTLIQSNPELNFVYTLRADDETFMMDTREIREILGDVSLDEPQVAVFLREYLTENTSHLQNRSIIL